MNSNVQRPIEATRLTLEQFRRERGWNYPELHRRLLDAGMPKRHVHSIRVACQRRRVPEAPVVIAAYVLSEGRVTPDSFYDLPPLASAAAPADGAAA